MATDGEAAHPLSTPQRLSQLLDCQAGSVVSRTLVKKPTGTLTLFAFDQGEGLSEHSTPHDAVVEVLDGTVKITIGGVPHRVSTGEGLLLPASIPHALTAITPFKMLLIMIREPAADQDTEER
jgi:quercetin dioxygenase-like cupin family protein